MFDLMGIRFYIFIKRTLSKSNLSDTTSLDDICYFTLLKSAKAFLE